MTPTNRKPGACTAAAVAATLLLTVACHREPPVAAAPAQPQVTFGPRDIAQAQRTTITAGIILTGSLNPYQEVEVRAQVPGVATGIHLDRGQPVRRGQRMAVIQAQGIRSQAVSADAQIAGADSSLALARRRFESAEMLFKRGAVSDLDFQTSRSQVEAAEAQVAAARAQAASSRESADRTVITAPLSGEISRRSVSEGEAVQPGQVLYTIVNPDILELAGQVPVDEAVRVRVNQPVQFALDAYPGRAFTGAVARIDPAADPATRQVGVFVRLPNASRALLGGLFATGRVLTGTDREAVVVPADALRGNEAGRYVWTVRDGTVARVAVTTGTRDEARGIVEITSGLEAGTTVVVSPGAQIEGARVTIDAPPATETERVRTAVTS